jgi:hypothetical protein
MKARRTRITVERIQPVTNTKKLTIIESSVADPGPDPYRMFLGLLDPDQDPSTIKQKILLFCDFFFTFIFDK